MMANIARVVTVRNGQPLDQHPEMLHTTFTKIKPGVVAFGEDGEFMLREALYSKLREMLGANTTLLPHSVTVDELVDVAVRYSMIHYRMAGTNDSALELMRSAIGDRIRGYRPVTDVNIQINAFIDDIYYELKDIILAGEPDVS